MQWNVHYPLLDSVLRNSFTHSKRPNWCQGHLWSNQLLKCSEMHYPLLDSVLRNSFTHSLSSWFDSKLDAGHLNQLLKCSEMHYPLLDSVLRNSFKHSKPPNWCNCSRSPVISFTHSKPTVISKCSEMHYPLLDSVLRNSFTHSKPPNWCQDRINCSNAVKCITHY